MKPINIFIKFLIVLIIVSCKDKSLLGKHVLITNSEIKLKKHAFNLLQDLQNLTKEEYREYFIEKNDFIDFFYLKYEGDDKKEIENIFNKLDFDSIYNIDFRDNRKFFAKNDIKSSQIKLVDLVFEKDEELNQLNIEALTGELYFKSGKGLYKILVKYLKTPDNYFANEYKTLNGSYKLLAFEDIKPVKDN